MLLHSLSLEEHAQTPFIHSLSEGQTLPQAPQLFVSLLRSLQVPSLHFILPVGQGGLITLESSTAAPDPANNATSPPATANTIFRRLRLGWGATILSPT
jgi:hypothetical protein